MADPNRFHRRTGGRPAGGSGRGPVEGGGVNASSWAKGTPKATDLAAAGAPALPPSTSGTSASPTDRLTAAALLCGVVLPLLALWRLS